MRVMRVAPDAASYQHLLSSKQRTTLAPTERSTRFRVLLARPKFAQVTADRGMLTVAAVSLARFGDYVCSPEGEQAAATATSVTRQVRGAAPHRCGPPGSIMCFSLITQSRESSPYRLRCSVPRVHGRAWYTENNASNREPCSVPE